MTKQEFERLGNIVRYHMEQNINNKLTEALATGIMNVVLAGAGEMVEQEALPDGESDGTTE
jgi:hypothetical protein